MNEHPFKLPKSEAVSSKRRSCDRLDVRILSTAATRDGERADVKLTNVSNYGCSGTGMLPSRPGDEIDIDLGALGFRPAVVKWCAPLTFGLAFVHPLTWRELLPFIASNAVDGGGEG